MYTARHRHDPPHGFAGEYRLGGRRVPDSHAFPRRLSLKGTSLETFGVRWPSKRTLLVLMYFLQGLGRGGLRPPVLR